MAYNMATASLFPSLRNSMDAYRVLSFGYDDVLMPVRTLLLRQAGYTVMESRSISNLLKKMKAGGFDVLLLCHTVPALQQEAMIEALHRAQPQVPFLSLGATPADLARAHYPPGCNIAPEFLVHVNNTLQQSAQKRAS